jgi:hypothetical protein
MRAWIRKRDILVIGVVCLVILLIWILQRYHTTQVGSTVQAEILYDGTVVQTVLLNRNGRFSLKQDETVQFLIEDGTIGFIDSTCPDHICERTGMLSKSGETAICLPKKVILRIVSTQQTSIDGITG